MGTGLEHSFLLQQMLLLLLFIYKCLVLITKQCPFRTILRSILMQFFKKLNFCQKTADKKTSKTNNFFLWWSGDFKTKIK